MKIDYLLTGVINGKYIEVMGEGKVDSEGGGFDLDLSVKHAPPGWDPGLIIMICCDNLRLYTAKKTSRSLTANIMNSLSSLQFGSFVNSTRQGNITDPDGNIIVHIKAKGFLFIDKDKDLLSSRTVITDGLCHLDKFGGIAEIKTPYFERITPTGYNTATGLSTYSLKCADGTVLRGETLYPYVFNDAQSPESEVTLSVEYAKVNSQNFLLKGESPKIQVKVVEQ